MKIMVYCDIPKLPLLNYDFLYVLRYHNLPSIRTISTNIAILRCLKMTRGSADVLSWPIDQLLGLLGQILPS